MSYYLQGDYYGARGDYYRGDPFFGFLGGLVKKGVGALAGLARKKVVTTAIEKVGPIVGRVRPHLPVIGAGVAGATIGAATARSVPRVPMGPVTGVPAGIPLSMEGVPRGYHIIRNPKSARFGAVVRNRRMRVTNVRALRRAIRRAHGFARLAKKCISFTQPRAVRGRPVFRKRRAKR